MDRGTGGRAGPRLTIFHVIGAGLAGLSAALALTGSGRAVRLYEAAPRAGGRCRSFFDPALDLEIDNGAHVMLGGNRALFAYLRRIGAADRLVAAQPEGFPFLDLRNGRRWVIRPNRGPLPWFLLAPGRRAPDTAAADYAWAIGRLLTAGWRDSVATRLGGRPQAYERVWRPLAVAALNMAPEEASARLFARTLAAGFLRGAGAARPFLARRSLADTLVDPAVATLQRDGTLLRTDARLRRIVAVGSRVGRLGFADAEVAVADGDVVILAVPPAAAVALLPDLVVPQRSTAILNLHFRHPGPGRPAMLGLLGGTSEWLFRRAEVATVTVSAADALMTTPSDDLAAVVWREIAPLLGASPERMPAVRVVKEKRATLAQDPQSIRLRPGARTRWSNLFLAGDWTDTGLPATIEGAIRSGHDAARVASAAEPV